MFEFSSIEQYHAQLQEGTITCVQVVEHYLRRIDLTKHLNAFIEVYAGEALLKAKQLDEKRDRANFGNVQPVGKLYGVVIGLKDVICYKDHAISASSKILNARLNDPVPKDSVVETIGRGFISIYSATVVERLLAADAIIIGNLNCDEFAMGSSNENSSYGNVLNALDETRVPGGSSGGSAVAVQAGLCMVSLGSDTGGSVRQPADFCGIIGLKPTYGRVSRYGLIAYASSFDQIGIFGNTIPDIAAILEVIAVPDEFDSTVSQKETPSYPSKLVGDRPFRFAYFNEALDHPGLDPEIASSIKKFIEQLKKQGHEVRPVEFEWLDYIVPAYYVLTTAEASSNLSRYDGVKYGYRPPDVNLELTEFYTQTRSAGFGKEVKRRIMLGTFVLSSGYYEAYFTRAQKVRKLLSDRTQLIFRDFDFILLPTSPVTAFKAGERLGDPISMYLADIYTVMANLVGTPAISVPLFKHSNGMPFGLQVMANRFDEVSLLQISNRLLQQIHRK